MSSAFKILPHYTYTDYCQWEGKWELIEGIPYAMSPTPVPGHQIVASNLVSEFRIALQKESCQCIASIYMDYMIADDTILQPDVLIVCKPITKKYLDFPPALVAEILSPATAMKDRNNKFSLYEIQQIPYYLIVDIDTRNVEVNKLNEENLYALQQVNQKEVYFFILEDSCSLPVILDNIWS